MEGYDCEDEEGGCGCEKEQAPCQTRTGDVHPEIWPQGIHGTQNGGCAQASRMKRAAVDVYCTVWAMARKVKLWVLILSMVAMSHRQRHA